jgi:hypothetical protein
MSNLVKPGKPCQTLSNNKMSHLLGNMTISGGPPKSFPMKRKLGLLVKQLSAECEKIEQQLVDSDQSNLHAQKQWRKIKSKNDAWRAFAKKLVNRSNYNPCAVNDGACPDCSDLANDDFLDQHCPLDICDEPVPVDEKS